MSICARRTPSARSFYERQAVRHSTTENVSIEKYDHANNRAQGDGVPCHKAEDDSFVADLLGSSCGDRNGLRIYHFSHHSPGAVGLAHQHRIDTELLRSDPLQTAEERIGRGIAARQRDPEPSKKCSKEWIEQPGTRERQPQHCIEP